MLFGVANTKSSHRLNFMSPCMVHLSHSIWNEFPEAVREGRVDYPRKSAAYLIKRCLISGEYAQEYASTSLLSHFENSREVFLKPYDPKCHKTGLRFGFQGSVLMEPEDNKEHYFEIKYPAPGNYAEIHIHEHYTTNKLTRRRL